MKRFVGKPLLLLVSLLTLLAGGGCSRTDRPEQIAIATARNALENARSTQIARYRIEFLQTAYEAAQRLKKDFPADPDATAFLRKYRKELDAIPQKVYTLALKEWNLKAFKWAVTHGARIDPSPESLKEIWNRGAAWQDFVTEQIPKRALPIFMEQAFLCGGRRYFERHIEQFRKMGFKPAADQDPVRFRANLRLFTALLISEAMDEKNDARILHLFDLVPLRYDADFIEPRVEAIIRRLAKYAFVEHPDEKIADRLIELEWPIDFDILRQSPFSEKVTEKLLRHPDRFFTEVLHLDRWHGPLMPSERQLLLKAPDSALRKVDPRYIDEVIFSLIDHRNNKKALRLIRLREQLQPYTFYDYSRIMKAALNNKCSDIFLYAKRQRGKFNIFFVALPELARDYQLFKHFAPQLFAHIYKEADPNPRDDGLTYGRIETLLITHRPLAVLYVVKHYDFPDWTKIMNGRTLLMDVCAGGNLEAAKYLVEKKGADVNAKSGQLSEQTTVFGKATAREGDLTPMFFAALSGNADLIRYLHSKGAMINERSAFGATPLMYAVSAGHKEAVETLIKLGADVTAHMNENLTPEEQKLVGPPEETATALRRARKLGDPEIIRLLENAGATE